MVRITSGSHTFDVDDGTRLVLALEANGVDVLHRCGGWAKCTTCRVEIPHGAPTRMTEAERDLLEARDLLGETRLSCQIACEGDMTVTPLMTVSGTDFDDAGAEPSAEITPDPIWI